MRVCACLLLLTGCYDFEGDLGRIGFSSNLVADGLPWNPELAIADGTVARFAAAHRVGDEEERPLDVRGDSELEVVEQEGASIAVTGERTRGVVRFDGEEHDHFRVRFATARELAWVHPNDRDLEVTHVGRGTELWMIASVRDRRGRSLGYDREALDVRFDDEQVEASLDGVWLPTRPVTVVDPEDIVEIEYLQSVLCEAIPIGRTAGGHAVACPEGICCEV